MSVRPVLLGLYEKYFLPLQKSLLPSLQAFITGLLPGLEEGSEIYDRLASCTFSKKLKLHINIFLFIFTVLIVFKLLLCGRIVSVTEIDIRRTRSRSSGIRMFCRYLAMATEIPFDSRIINTSKPTLPSAEWDNVSLQQKKKKCCSNRSLLNS